LEFSIAEFNLIVLVRRAFDELEGYFVVILPFLLWNT